MSKRLPLSLECTNNVRHGAVCFGTGKNIAAVSGFANKTFNMVTCMWFGLKTVSKLRQI
jgi:hypothetical protein